jgi:hypothetical protein
MMVLNQVLEIEVFLSLEPDYPNEMIDRIKPKRFFFTPSRHLWEAYCLVINQ